MIGGNCQWRMPFANGFVIARSKVKSTASKKNMKEIVFSWQSYRSPWTNFLTNYIMIVGNFPDSCVLKIKLQK